jgi:hypothetical protein
MRYYCRSAFHDAKVDIYVDRVLRERPTSRFSWRHCREETRAQ